jgi:hypothetical protein
LYQERGEFPEEAFVLEYIHGDLNCRPWVGAQQLPFGRHYGGILGRDFEHLELNEVIGGKPARNESSVLCANMHRKDI